MINSKLFRYLLFPLVTILLISCSVGPSTIAYNEDQCASCKMLISDHRFGAELVTKKGRIYKYDAIECMVQTLEKKSEDEYAYIMVTDYHHPGQLINAKDAKYIISEERPSPMGAFLSAYASETKIENLNNETTSSALDWNQMTKRLNR